MCSACATCYIFARCRHSQRFLVYSFRTALVDEDYVWLCVCVRACECVWRGKWPNLQRFPIIYYYVYLRCDGPTDLIRSPHRIVCFFLSPPKHIVFVRRMRAFVRLLLLGPTTRLNTIEKVSSPFLVFRWTCVASIARWIVSCGVCTWSSPYTLFGDTTLWVEGVFHAKRGPEKESEREVHKISLVVQLDFHYVHARKWCMEGCATHTYAIAARNHNGRSMGFHGHTTTHTHTHTHTVECWK